jgi:hypothetical protein
MLALKEKQVHAASRHPLSVLLYKELQRLLVNGTIDHVANVVDDSIDFPHDNYLPVIFLLDIFQFRNTESSPFPDYGEHG